MGVTFRWTLFTFTTIILIRLVKIAVRRGFENATLLTVPTLIIWSAKGREGGKSIIDFMLAREL